MQTVAAAETTSPICATKQPHTTAGLTSLKTSLNKHPAFAVCSFVAVSTNTSHRLLLTYARPQYTCSTAETVAHLHHVFPYAPNNRVTACPHQKLTLSHMPKHASLRSPFQMTHNHQCGGSPPADRALAPSRRNDSHKLEIVRSSRFTATIIVCPSSLVSLRRNEETQEKRNTKQ